VRQCRTPEHASGESQSGPVEAPSNLLSNPHFSWDNLWITFYVVTGLTARQIFIAPFRGGVAPAHKEWIAVTDGLGMDREPQWSPDDNLIYFLSQRDQFQCIGLSVSIVLRSVLFLQPSRYIISTVRAFPAGTRTRAIQDWRSPGQDRSQPGGS
jgi:hypothetical protein